MLASDTRPVANPMVVFREEFDDWAVLFDPDTGNAFGVGPVGALIWKQLDGHHTFPEIVALVEEKCEDVPPEVEADVVEFVQSLLDLGMAGQEV